MDAAKASLQWCSDEDHVGEKTDAWENILSQTYRDWNVKQRLPPTFYAHVSEHKFSGISIVETVCDPCVGTRTIHEVRRDDQLYIGVQLTESGHERFQFEDQCVEVNAGDLIVWTTGAAAQFEVLEKLHKVTLMIPWPLLKDRFPECKHPPSGGKIESHSGVGLLLAKHMMGLSRIDILDKNMEGAVCRSTLELLGATLFRPQQGMLEESAVRLQLIRDFILQHLHEDDLTPAKIAESNRISVRHLHNLFHSGDITVSKYILQQRLHACKQVLIDPEFQQLQISEIAFNRGFNSISHFCRAFKALYGLSPGDIRNQAQTTG